MSEEREKGGLERFGVAFAHNLRSQGERILDESAQRLRGSSLTDADFTAAQQGFTESAEKIRLSQNVATLFRRLDTILIEAGLAAPFQDFVAKFLDDQIDGAEAIKKPSPKQRAAGHPDNTKTAETTKADKTERQIGRGIRQKKLVLGMLEANEEGTGYKYSTIDDLVPEAYSDKPGTREQLTKVNKYNAITTLNYFIGNLSRDGGRPENTQTILDEIRSRPEFANITHERVIKALKREISYAELVGKNKPTSTTVPESKTVQRVIQSPVARSGVKRLEQRQGGQSGMKTNDGVGIDRDSRYDLSTILGESGGTRLSSGITVVPNRNHSDRERRLNGDLYEHLDISTLNEWDQVLYACFEVRDDRKGWRNIDISALVDRIYEKDLATKTRGQLERTKSGYFMNITRRHTRILQALKESAGLPIAEMRPEIKHFMGWLKEQPLFRKLTPSEIIQIMQRESDPQILIAKMKYA